MTGDIGNNQYNAVPHAIRRRQKVVVIATRLIAVKA